MKRWLFPLQCALLALVLTWPAPARFFTGAVGSVDADGVKHLWTLWWMRAELFHGVGGLQTTYVNWPVGMQLYPIEPLNGLLSVLIPLPTVPLSNALAIVHLFLLGLASGWLGRLVSERDAGAHVAGALAQGSAFAAFTLHVGVGELRQAWWIPLGLACLVRARESGQARWFAALGATLVGAMLSCFYHGFFLATAVALYALCTLRPDPRLLASYAATALLSAGIVVPVVRTFAATYEPDESQVRASFGEWMSDRYELNTFRGAALDPVELLRARDTSTVTDRQAAAYTGGRYLGWSALVLALMGVAAAPRRAAPWVVVAAGGLLLSLGSVLWWDGSVVGGSGGRIVLPLAMLNRALDYVAEPLNFPARFLAVTTVALSVLGALATRWPLRWGGSRAALVPLLLAPVAVVEVTWGDLVPFPRAMIDLPTVDAAAVAARGVPDGPLLDLTAFTMAQPDGPTPPGTPGASWLVRLGPEAHTRAIGAQIALDRPFSSVPIERIDHWAPDGVVWASALPLGRAVAGETVEEAGLRASAWLLADKGYVGAFVTHRCGQRAPAGTAVLDRVLGPGIHATCATVWKVAADTPKPEDGDRWKASVDALVASTPRASMGPQFPDQPHGAGGQGGAGKSPAAEAEPVGRHRP